MYNARDKILSVKQMRLVDARAVSLGLPVCFMMENAGNALARYMARGLGNLEKKNVVVVCGLSNNGGGGFSSARHLSHHGANVTVVLLGKPADLRTKDTELQWKTIEKVTEISKIAANTNNKLKDIRKVISGADGIIDAILGTGYSGDEIREPVSTAIDLINSSKAYVVSNDVPSGVDADTGAIRYKAVSPDITVALHQKKAGLAKVGPVAVVSVGIPQ
ncbi:MAG: NAD(P)H-hydrate epimerase [Nitrososphaera sp.]